MPNHVLLPYTLILTLILVATIKGQTPPYITWPQQFHSSISLEDSSGALLPQSSFPVQYNGQFYYDANSNITVFLLNEIYTGRQVREVVTINGVYIIDGPTGSCTFSNNDAKPRWTMMQPSFLSTLKFAWVGQEYYNTQLGAFVLTYHWTFTPPLPQPTVDYWHNEELLAPFRLSWFNVNPSILEFSNVITGFGNAPVTASLNGTAWPQQWHGTSAFTGNAFGLTSDKAALGEPTTVPISLEGEYYYDWTNQRECNIWIDAASGVRTKTLIVNGTYFLISLATNSCQIVPISPVNGPLKYDWPTRIPFQDEQFLWTEGGSAGSWMRANHYILDALNAGEEHSFNYWQDPITGAPMQFQGPVLEFFPYGQSMMVWSQVINGLGGLDLDDIFSLPPLANCTHLESQSVELPLTPFTPLVLYAMSVAV